MGRKGRKGILDVLQRLTTLVPTHSSRWPYWVYLTNSRCKGNGVSFRSYGGRIKVMIRWLAEEYKNR
jgi:hypothetical protein